MNKVDQVEHGSGKWKLKEKVVSSVKKIMRTNLKAIVLLRKDKLSPTIWNTQEDGKMVQICSITVEWQKNDTILILS